jgi:hypothetical protein
VCVCAGEDGQQRCSPTHQYAMSKLAIIAASHELHNRLVQAREHNLVRERKSSKATHSRKLTELHTHLIQELHDRDVLLLRGSDRARVTTVGTSG